ncbi:hypothetical protein BC629DRAFT_1535820, partial [Irpex lacteus]
MQRYPAPSTISIPTVVARSYHITVLRQHESKLFLTNCLCNPKLCKSTCLPDTLHIPRRYTPRHSRRSQHTCAEVVSFPDVGRRRGSVPIRSADFEKLWDVRLPKGLGFSVERGRAHIGAPALTTSSTRQGSQAL